MEANTLQNVPHPYYPTNANISKYVPNDRDLLHLLLLVTGGFASLLLLTHTFAKSRNPDLTTSDVLTVMWFILSKMYFFACVTRNLTLTA